MRRFSENLPFGYEFTAGLGYADLDLALSSATMRAAEDISSPAFRLGGAGIWRIKPTTRVEAGASVLAAKSSSFDGIVRLDVSLRQSLGQHVTVHGGYSNWQIDAPGAGRSAIEFRFSGPSVGLGVTF